MRIFVLLFFLQLLSLNVSTQVKVNIKDDVAPKQDNYFIKEIDFLNTNKNIWDDTVKYNQKYSYKLINFNRLVFKQYTAEQKGENFNTERPAVLKGLAFPGFLSVKGVQPGPASRGESDSVEIKKILKSIDSCQCVDIVKYLTIVKDKNQELAVVKGTGETLEKLSAKFETYPELNQELDKLKKNTVNSFNRIDSTKRSLIKKYTGVESGENDTSQVIVTFYQQLYENAQKQINDRFYAATNTLIRESELLAAKYQPCISGLEKKLCGIKDTCSISYDFIVQQIREKKLCVRRIQSFIQGLRDDINEADAALKTMKAAIKELRIYAVQQNYNMLERRNFELYIEPFVADKDKHVITFTAKADAALEYGVPATRTIKVNAVTYGGFKIDFSTGAFFNWGSNNFLGPKYFYEIPTDSTKIIREAGRTKSGLLSIGALMHVSYRTRSFLRPALSFGISTTSGFNALNFHGGVSLILGRPGKANRVILSYGITLREVDLLSSGYTVNTEGENFPVVVPVSKNFPVRGNFFALTYNLTGVNK